MADVHLPGHAAAALSRPAAPLDIDAATVGEAIERMDERWPGLRDRLCAGPAEIRPHIHVYVDRERAELDTELTARSRIDVIAAISGG